MSAFRVSGRVSQRQQPDLADMVLSNIVVEQSTRLTLLCSIVLKTN